MYVQEHGLKHEKKKRGYRTFTLSENLEFLGLSAQVGQLKGQEIDIVTQY